MQPAQLHVQERQAGLKVGGVLREQRLLHAHFHGVAVLRGLSRRRDARAARAKISVYYPELEFCTDNGAMIALAGALRFQAGKSIKPAGAFAVRPRWPLAELTESTQLTDTSNA